MTGEFLSVYLFQSKTNSILVAEEVSFLFVPSQQIAQKGRFI